jgi:hypothetical protein
MPYRIGILIELSLGVIQIGSYTRASMGGIYSLINRGVPGEDWVSPCGLLPLASSSSKLLIVSEPNQYSSP